MIRPYEPKDLNELLNAWHSASQVGHPFLSEDFFKQERKDIATLFLPKAEVWVYEQNSKVIGYISLRGNEVGGLFVDTEFQRQGVGHALLEHVKPLREVLELDVFEDNSIGRAFYAKNDFKQVGRYLCEETGFMQLKLKLECS